MINSNLQYFTSISIKKKKNVSDFLYKKMIYIELFFMADLFVVFP